MRLAAFTARDYVSGMELWKSNGTVAGTVLVKDIFPGLTSSHFGHFVNAGGKIFFDANDGVHGRELWSVIDIPSTVALTWQTFCQRLQKFCSTKKHPE